MAVKEQAVRPEALFGKEELKNNVGVTVRNYYSLWCIERLKQRGKFNDELFQEKLRT